jgi:hypothetical protein
VWAYPPLAQVVVEGKENLGSYLFNKRAATKRFCKICGVLVCSEITQFTKEEVAQMSEQMRAWYNSSKDLAMLNLRVINGLDVNKDLTTEKFDGYNHVQPLYVEP